MTTDNKEPVQADMADIFSQIDQAIDADPSYAATELPPSEPSEPESAGKEPAADDEKKADENAENVPETAEQKAIKAGWKPKEESADDEDWVDAEEFNRRKPLLDRLGKQDKELKRVKTRLDNVIKGRKEEVAKVRAEVMAELQAKRKEAFEDADLERFDAAEEAIKKANAEATEQDAIYKDEEEETPPPQQEIKIPTFVKEFADKNVWFDKDQDMTLIFVNKTESLVSQDGLTLQQAMDKALMHIHKVFPHKFENPNKNRPSPVMSSSRETKPKGLTLSDLTSEQRDLWKIYKSHGITEKEFLTSLSN